MNAAPSPAPGPAPRRQAPAATDPPRGVPPTPVDGAERHPGAPAQSPHGSARPEAGAPPARPPDPLALALRRLQLLVEDPPEGGVELGNWRWRVRQQVTALRDALTVESAQTGDPWLAAVGGGLLQERQGLLVRMAEAGPAVLSTPEVDDLRAELRQLMADTHEHVVRARAWRDR